MLLFINGLTGFGCIMLMVVLSKRIRIFYRGNDDIILMGLLYSVFFAIFAVVVGAVGGLLISVVPQFMQGKIASLLAPVAQVALYGSSTGLIFFSLLSVSRDVQADIKDRFNKRKKD